MKDNQLSSSIDQLSSVLEQFAFALDRNAKAKGDAGEMASAFVKNGVVAHLVTIEKSLDEIKAQGDKMYERQETLINAVKSLEKRENPVLAAGNPDTKKTLGQGVKSLLLISAGVLALALAYRVVGDVDFVSVAAFGVSIVAISMAVEKIAQSEELTGKKILMATGAMIAISAAIALSSYILAYTKPVGLFQLFTAIGIAAAFVVISNGLENIAKSIDKVSAKSLAMMPAVLLGASTAIMLSSHVLGQVSTDVTPYQLFLAAAIGVAFVPIAFVMPMIAKSMEKISPAKIAILPIMLLGISTAVMLSSHILANTRFIEPSLILNIVFQSVGLAVASLALGFAFSAMARLGADKVAIGSALSLLVVGAMVAASHILNLGLFQNYPSLDWTIGVGASMLAFGLASVALGLVATSGVGAAAVPLGAAMTLLLAGTMVAADYILSAGTYAHYPSADWAFGVGAAMLPFALGTVALGTIAISGVGALALLAGMPLVLGVASTMVAASHILSQGNYSISGDYMGWASATAGLYATFVPSILLLGGIGVAGAVLSVFGADPFTKGNEALLGISNTITQISHIFANGNWTSGPSETWAKGVSLAIGAFAPIYKMLALDGLMGIFGGGVSMMEFNNAIRTISQGIVFSAGLFAQNTAAFVNGPPESWAKGVGGAISAFAPVYTALSENSGWFSSGITPETFRSAITTITEGIVHSANMFSASRAVFDPANAPSEMWAKGVSGAISAFMPALEYIQTNSSWFGSGEERLKTGIGTITMAMVASSLILAKGKWSMGVPSGWMDSVAGNIRKYVSLSQEISGSDTSGIAKATFGMLALSRGYNALASGLEKLNAQLRSVDMEKLEALKSLSGTMVLMSLMDADQFQSMMDALEDRASVFVDIAEKLSQDRANMATMPVLPTVSAAQQGTPGRTLDDIYNVMAEMQRNISALAGYGGNVSGWVDEMRTEDARGGLVRR